MDGRGRASRRAASVALVLAVGCGSSGAIHPTDATDVSDTAKDAGVDGRAMPADGFDPCPPEPGCGLLSPERIDDCTYALPAEPPEPGNVGVYFTGDGGLMRIPRDSQDHDGWDYVDATYTSIRLYGGWCDEDRSGMFGPPMVIAGCPGLCIP
jgi:hypothetical protein